MKRHIQSKATHTFSLCWLLLCLSLLSLFLTACSLGDTDSEQGQSHFTSPSNKIITYSTNAQDVIIRTFYGGGRYGSFALGPQVSIYGDGSYIIGLDQQGQLETAPLQELLNTLIDQDGLLDLHRQQFSEIQDQNATYLELSVNHKQVELVYGTFTNPQSSQRDQDEYNRLGKALTAITETLTTKTHPYKPSNYALLARKVYFNNPQQVLPEWTLNDFTLAQAASFVCGPIPENITSPNFETGCLKYTRPLNAILLTPTQFQNIHNQITNQNIIKEDDSYYQVILRPLLPDELPKKMVALFGSAQLSYSGVPLHEGALPPVTGK